LSLARQTPGLCSRPGTRFNRRTWAIFGGPALSFPRTGIPFRGLTISTRRSRPIPLLHLFGLFVALALLLLTVATAGAAAPHCAPGQEPQFVLGFAFMKSQLGDVMGEPLECEHPNPDNGDSLQQTATGLAFYRLATNTPTFTDGWNHWA
jgi:hypothetical protein